jgi:hypothetical protein
MIMIRRFGLALASLGLAAGGFIAVAGAAGAAPLTTVTGTTYIANHPDGGHGTPGTWAYDDFHRTLTVTANADQTGCTHGDTCYTATIADNGKFNAIVGNGSPNGTGAVIKHAVQGSMVGSYALTVVAPASDTLNAAGIPGYRNDHFGSPVTSTTNWPTLAFTAPGDAVVSGGAYNWTYTDACEKWVDSSANGDGAGAADGNITGRTFCVVSTGAAMQVKNRATGKCLNESQYNGLLSTFTCLPGTYVSLKWKVVTFSDGTTGLQSVQTGKYIKDNGQGSQLSQVGYPVSVRFLSGGVVAFSDNLVMTVNRQGSFVPVIAEPGLSPLNNGRWDLSAA